MTTRFAGHLLTGTHAARPAANAVPDGTLYSCTDHNLIYQSDGATWSTWATIAPPGGGASPVYNIVRYVAGDITVSSTTAGAAMPSVGNVVVPAVSGDLAMIGVNFRDGNSNANAMRVDVATIVSAAAVNYLSSRGGTPASTGVSGWFGAPDEEYHRAGEIPYVVVAGDLSGGNLTLGLRAWMSAGTRLVIAQAAGALEFWARNLGQ